MVCLALPSSHHLQLLTKFLTMKLILLVNNRRQKWCQKLFVHRICAHIAVGCTCLSVVVLCYFSKTQFHLFIVCMFFVFVSFLKMKYFHRVRISCYTIYYVYFEGKMTVVIFMIIFSIIIVAIVTIII